MIIYETSKGNGYNPMLLLNGIVNNNTKKMWLWRTSKSNRKIAYVNTYIFFLIIIFSLIYLATGKISAYLYVSIAALLFSIFGLMTIKYRSKEFFLISENLSVSKFSLSIFTFEWIIFYLSITMFSTSLKTISTNGFLYYFLSFISITAIAFMFFPLIESSKYYLVKKNI